MRIIVTTSNKYHHLLRIFIYLFNHNWDENQQVEIAGYARPSFELPTNFRFSSIGEQIGDAHNFSTDLRKYFEKQDEWLIWLFDDSFIRSVNFQRLNILKSYTTFRNVDKIGRINLSAGSRFQDFIKYQEIGKYQILENTQTSNYRLSTQPSIWSRDFLLKYLTPNLTPWEFETQHSINDGWKILGPEDAAVEHNEGVTRHNIYDYNFHKVEESQINEMKQLGII